MGMYRKLQRKILWGSTLVLLLVIAAVVGIIYWVSINIVEQQSQVLINLILDNGGTLPERSEFAYREEAFLALNEESIYETRYFSILLSDEEPQVMDIHIAAVSEDAAIALAEEADELSRKTGTVRVPGNRYLQYAKHTEENGDTLIVFMDNTSRYRLSRLIINCITVLWLMVLVIFMIVMSRVSKKLVQPFVENDEKQKRFITNASHELKTPLAVISANNEMTEAIGGKTKWTQSTSRQVNRLQSLIEDLVVLARLDEIENLSLSDVNLSQVVSEAAESFRSVIEASGKQYVSRIEPDLHVTGEKRALQQLTSILLDNAVKYCDEGGTVSVCLEERPKGKGAFFSVSNTYADGKNIDLSRLFERFYRQDESHNSEKTGFGIGLSMAKEITERLKGKIMVDYKEDTIQFSIEL